MNFLFKHFTIDQWKELIVRLVDKSECFILHDFKNENIFGWTFSIHCAMSYIGHIISMLDKHYMHRAWMTECVDKMKVWKQYYDGKQCTYCDKVSRTLLKCSKCLRARYCDNQCQKQDWHTLHKQTCKKLKS